MNLANIFAKLLARKDAALPDDQTATLGTPYSNRQFQITGRGGDISVLGQIAKTGGVWEPHIMNLMAKIIRPSNTCLDIGANIGALTLAMADLANEGVVHSFEPSSINHRFLAMNIRQNGLQNAHAHAIGLGRAAGHAEFTNIVGMEGCSFVNPPDQSVNAVVSAAWGENVMKKSEVVTIRTLDDWMDRQKLDQVDFVKMDVEGCELAVLDGGQETFARYRPKMIIELNRNTLQIYFGIEPHILFERLAEIYSHLYLISEDEAPPRRVTSFAEIEPLLDIPNHWWVDLLCQPGPL
jgi:FkbM family methyltransferase